jgi:hypothetical protein
MLHALRSMMERSCPSLMNPVLAIRHKYLFHKVYSGTQERVRRQLFPDGKPVTVQTGPFHGMRYLDETVWGSITPRWLGSYECELHPVIDEIIARGYLTIVDVGCAEGYYAVGLARAISQAKVIAFDTDFLARRQLLRLARMNHVADRIEARAYCSHGDLEALCQPGALIVCDIEGFELQLLNPRQAPGLYRTDMLVEIHDPEGGPPLIQQTLCDLFVASHEIATFDYNPQRDAWIEQNIGRLRASGELLREAANEHRPMQRWLWMRSRQAPA